MRRLASEVIRNLERRVARLEKKSGKPFTLKVALKYVYRPGYRERVVQEYLTKVLIEDMAGDYSLREVSSEVKKLLKDVEEVFHQSGYDPTDNYHTFEVTGNNFEWVRVDGFEDDAETLHLAYVRTTDQSYNRYTSPTIEVSVRNPRNRNDSGHGYFLNKLVSDMTLRTVRYR